MTLEGIHFWPEVLNALSLKTGNPIFKQWINITSAKYDPSGKVVTIDVPNALVKDQLSKVLVDISEIMDQIMFCRTSLDICIKKNEEQQPLTISPRPIIEARPKAKNQSNFIPRFTFENFIVGSNNQFAYASCLSVAARPSKSYNPLFIFGHSGLGKTHLLHAIGNYICQYSPSISVLYTNGEKFLNEYVKAIRGYSIDTFRKKFREDYEVILIDDIQFIAGIEGKGKFQEEFFHTIAYLQDHNKQVVIASDKFPDEIEGLDTRLRTRFSSGLICDIKIPELETRIAIVTTKAKSANIPISPKAAIRIAELFTGSIRELEGAVTSIGAFSSFANTEVTPDFIDEIYYDKKLNIKEKTSIDINRIIKMVASHYQVNTSDIYGNDRKKELILPRHVSIYIAKQLTNKPLTELARIFKRKNHSTILHAYEKIEDLKKTDPLLKKDIDYIINELKNS